MTPRANPIKPPKVKILKVPKLSWPIFEIICLFNSKPIAPKRDTNRHSRGPALPKIAEKATRTESAHLIAVVMVLP